MEKCNNCEDFIYCQEIGECELFGMDEDALNIAFGTLALNANAQELRALHVINQSHKKLIAALRAARKSCAS